MEANGVKHSEDANEAKVDGMAHDSGVSTMPQIEGEVKAKRGSKTAGTTKGRGKAGTVYEGNVLTAEQHLSPTLAKLNMIELGKLVKFDELDSGQIREREYDPKRVEFFASKYRAGESVPPPVAIQVPNRSKAILADSHRRCLGGKAAGNDEIMVDIYEGTELDVIQVGLELNSSGPTPLKAADLVKAAVKTQALGVRPNITKLVDMIGTSRTTARKLYEREISKTGGVLDAFKPVKQRKTKEEVADDIAIRVLEALEEGNNDVVLAIFAKIPDDIRPQHIKALIQRYGDNADE